MISDTRLTRRATLGGAVAASALFAAGLAPRLARAQDATPTGETPVPGGTLRATISEEPDFLDPARTILLTSASLMNKIYDGLVTMDPDGLPMPWIAESWEISDDSRVITFTIRDGLLFTDGTPVDAAAIKANFDRHLDPEVTSPRRSNLGTLQTVEAPDASTVVFTFEEPYAPFFSALADMGIYSPTAYDADPDGFGRAPVGSGPFVLANWETGTSLRFERNPDYVNYRTDDLNPGAPYLDAIEYYIIPEPQTQSAAFENGELDILIPGREELARLSELPGIQIFSFTDSNNLNFIEFGNFAPFDNELLRKAISYAINREQVIEIAYFGQATLNQCPIPVGNAAYDAELCAEFGTVYDPEAAKAALAEAGWTDADGDGFVEIDGSAEPITLYSYAPFPVQARAIELMQGDLQAVGLNIDVQTLEISALLSAMSAGEVPMDYMRWTLSDQQIISRMFKSPGWSNQMSDPDLDELLTTADTTLEPAARIEASQAAMQYLLEHYLIVPVCSDWVQTLMQANVRDYHWDFLTYERLNDVGLAQ